MKPEGHSEAKGGAGVRKHLGPYVFAGDLVSKLLRKHFRAAAVVFDENAVSPEVVRLLPLKGGRGCRMADVAQACEVVGNRHRVPISVQGDGLLVLPDEVWINRSGLLRLPPVGLEWKPPVPSGLIKVTFRRPELEPGYAAKRFARR